MHYGVVRSGRRHGRNERDNPEGDTIHTQPGRRVIFKNLMEGVFLSLYDTNREMYEGLERRIKEELDYDKNRYYVKTGIVEREFFDASHHLLSPMDESDLAEKLYDMK